MMTRRRPAQWPRMVGLTVASLILIAYSLGPFYWVLTVSITSETKTFAQKVAYWPAEATLANYAILLDQSQFLVHFRNSTIVATATMALTLVVSTLAAYSFARFRFPGRRVMISGLLLIYMVPGVVLLVPLLIIFKNLQLINTHPALILAEGTVTIPFAVWMLTNYFASLPRDLDEAAMVDGCTPIGAFLRVILPLSIPGVIAAALFVFIAAWNNFLFAYLLTSSEDVATLPVFLRAFRSMEGGIFWGRIMAGAMLTTLPVTLLFLFFQRYMIGGLAAGSVKG